jgi:hypothetical protein
MKDAQGHGSAAHGGGVNQVGIPATMTRKHFQLIANNFANSPTRQSDPVGHAKQVNSMADDLAKTNPRFDRAKFAAASGVNTSPAARADAAGSHRYPGSGTGYGGIGERKLTTRSVGGPNVRDISQNAWKGRAR